mgnify:CR=1 FL=1
MTLTHWLYDKIKGNLPGCKKHKRPFVGSIGDAELCMVCFEECGFNWRKYCNQ